MHPPISLTLTKSASNLQTYDFTRRRVVQSVATDISILIPVYNERDNIRPLLAELESVLIPLRRSFEIIIVDDGSNDGSTRVLSEAAAEKSYLKVIFFRANRGQTAAFDAGFRHACGKTIVTLDADLQNDPHDIPQMLALLGEGYDFVAGWRKVRRDGFVLRTIPSRIANKIIRVVTGTKIHDLGCSLKVYRKEITDELHLYGEMHRFIGVMVEGTGAKVGEFVVNHRPRASGKSKYNLTRTFKVLLDLLTIWFLQGYHTKPIYAFGGFGFSLLGLSTLLSMFVLWQKFYLGIWVHRNPVFSIAIFFALVGFQFVALGLLAEITIRTYFATSKQAPYSIRKSLGFARDLGPDGKSALEPLEPVLN